MSQTDRLIDAPVLLHEVGMVIPTGYVVNLDNYDSFSFQAICAGMMATSVEFRLYESIDGVNFSEMVDFRENVGTNGTYLWDFEAITTRFLQFIATPVGGAVDFDLVFYGKRH
jgi:hypothetical protein